MSDIEQDAWEKSVTVRFLDRSIKTVIGFARNLLFVSQNGAKVYLFDKEYANLMNSRKENASYKIVRLKDLNVWELLDAVGAKSFSVLDLPLNDIHVLKREYVFIFTTLGNVVDMLPIVFGIAYVEQNHEVFPIKFLAQRTDEEHIDVVFLGW